jgi:diguanylate cyclase (GGDEF)-like protein/PAS domain S-box-containing protein
MALICPCLPAAAEPIRLQLRWHHQFQFAGYYAALDKGYYKKAGLDVIIHEGTPEKKPVQEVLQGYAQYGEANSELLLERLRGAPLVALAAVYQHSPSVLIARKDAGISSPDDLVGKKIMLMDQTVDADFVAMFNNEDVDISHLHLIPSSYEIGDLVDGEVDAFNSYLSNEPYFLKQQGVEFTVLNPRNYGVDFYSDILFTTENELKQHPERVKAFRQASLEGWYYAMDHPQEIIDLLLNKYKVSKSREHLEFEADAIRSLIVPDVIDLGHMNPWRWRHMTETFIKAGMVENDKFLQDFSYDPDQASQEQLLGTVKISVGLVLFAGVISLTLLAAYRALKRKNKIAARNEKLLLLAYETAGMGYFVTDLTTGRWENSPLLDQIFGIDAHFERDTPNWVALIHPKHRQLTLDHYQETIRNRKQFSIEYAIIRASDNKTRWVIGHGDIEYDQAGNPSHLVGAIQDITERKETEAIIHNLAYYDPLTALPNRRLLLEQLKHAIELERRDSRHLALLMLDLDHFKAVNDNLGHLAGDELLQQAAARIKASLREVDTVARLGGDEFVVLLEDITHSEDAARVAEDIIANLSKPFQLLQNNNTYSELSRKVRIGASIGISLFPQHGDSPETLLDNADIALYKAKDEGRGCFAYFSEEFTLIARERIALETRLRHAIEQQHLCVYYQAQIDIDSGLIVGAEALVRWQDPSEGLIPPNRFIPIAEETGLIVDIGAWVLRETCLQGTRWIEAGLPSITLAVNISPHQLRRSNISALVAEVLQETGFPAALLELELTESGLMENEEKAVEVLNNLRAQGVRLAIDDFGTGYSSLAYLKRFPLDVLKIDKSFIDDIPSLQDDMEITATIIAMGHILGFKVVAEGVETLEQLAFLREKGCDTYQGYIKSEPLPAEEFARLLHDQAQFLATQ